ncbi:MAG: alpha/beta hydrolase fold domain-containing protein [Acutalibacteraceae bacterium]
MEPFSVAGCPGYRIGPKGRRAEKAVLFLHGGAFVLQITPFHYRWIAHMIDALGVCVYVPLYPLAPRERCDRALDNLLCYYRRVLQSYAGADVTFAGDSRALALPFACDARARPRAAASGAPRAAVALLFALRDGEAACRDEGNRKARRDAVDQND